MYAQINTGEHSLIYICIHEYFHVHMNIKSDIYIGTYTRTRMQDAMTINIDGTHCGDATHNNA